MFTHSFPFASAKKYSSDKPTSGGGVDGGGDGGHDGGGRLGGGSDGGGGDGGGEQISCPEASVVQLPLAQPNVFAQRGRGPRLGLNRHIIGSRRPISDGIRSPKKLP